MSKKVYTNSALSLQLQLVSEIGELLKNRGVNISSLKVDLKAVKKKKKVFNRDDKDIIVIEGDIYLSINSKLNEKNSVYKFSEEDEDEKEVLQDDYNKD